MGKQLTVWLGLVALLSFWGCTSVSDFSTGSGECYEGSIVEADYIRSSSFNADLNLTLTLDVAMLQECYIINVSDQSDVSECKNGGRITTDDEPATFENAKVFPFKQIPHDSFSLFSFPGGRIHNFITYALPREGPPAMVVISLMENDEVEVRIIRPPGDSEYTDLFGVFRLVRKEGCLGGARGV